MPETPYSAGQDPVAKILFYLLIWDNLENALCYKTPKHFSAKPFRLMDGEVGHTSDFLFDDASWAIRDLVVDTGPRLSHRLTLLGPDAFKANALAATNPLLTNVSRTQIDGCPPYQTYPTISRAYEDIYNRHYGCASRRDPSNPQDSAVSTINGPELMGDSASGNSHVRSARSIEDYHLQANDGAIGKVVSFTVNTRKWTFAELVVETGHWYSSERILILPESIERSSHKDSTVFVALSIDEIRTTKANDVAQSVIISR